MEADRYPDRGPEETSEHEKKNIILGHKTRSLEAVIVGLIVTKVLAQSVYWQPWKAPELATHPWMVLKFQNKESDST